MIRTYDGLTHEITRICAQWNARLQAYGYTITHPGDWLAAVRESNRRALVGEPPQMVKLTGLPPRSHEAAKSVRSAACEFARRHAGGASIGSDSPPGTFEASDKLDETIDRLILEAQADLPCYRNFDSKSAAFDGDWDDPDFSAWCAKPDKATCPSCRAREKLTELMPTAQEHRQ